VKNPIHANTAAKDSLFLVTTMITEGVMRILSKINFIFSSIWYLFSTLQKIIFAKKDCIVFFIKGSGYAKNYYVGLTNARSVIRIITGNTDWPNMS